MAQEPEAPFPGPEDGEDARGPATCANNNMEVVHFSQQNSYPVHFSQQNFSQFSQLSQSQGSFAVWPDALSAAVIEQTVNALPLQPDSISDVKGPMLKLKRVDSKSVDVRVVHSFTAHYPTRLTSRRVIEHADPPLLDSQATERPALTGAPSQLEPAGKPAADARMGAARAGGSSLPRSPFARSEDQQQQQQQQPEQGDVDMGVECEPVVVEFEEPEAVAAPMPACPCPGQGVWELDASHIQMGKRVGVGGYSEVFVAKYEGTLVAVKRLLNTGSETAQQLCTEVSLLAQLRHPNLLLFMGYTTKPELCIVSEFMARGSLYNILRGQHKTGRLLEPRLQRVVAISVARGMLYLHTRNPPILHLDLKSPNILVDDRWRVKIADFGLSKARARTFVSTSVGSGAGTPEWMAPEMLRCEPLDDRADVYSYGVVLWELLTGDAPWEMLNAMQVVGAVGFAGKRLPAPKTGDPCLLALCSACLSSTPSARPSFQQIVETLDAHFAANPLSGGSTGAPSPLGIGDPSPTPPPQQEPAPALLPAASAPPPNPSPHPAAPAANSHLQHALTIATPADRRSPSRQSVTPLGRRRERSPDSVDESPPAITTRLANGAKHPSPRLPTPTDPTFLQHITPLPPAAAANPARATDSPRAVRLAPAHTHAGHAPTALPTFRPASFSSLPAALPDPVPTPPAAPAAPAAPAPAPAPYVSPFAQNADAPWASQSQSQRDFSPLDPSQPQSQLPDPADDPAFVSPFAALAAQITKSLAGHPLPDAASEDDDHLDCDPPPAAQPSPFAAFASLPADVPPEPPRATVHSPPPAADSPVHSWLLMAGPAQHVAAAAAEAAASTATTGGGTVDEADDPMDDDDDDLHPHDASPPHHPPKPHSPPSSEGQAEGRAYSHSLPLWLLAAQGQAEQDAGAAAAGDEAVEAVMAGSDIEPLPLMLDAASGDAPVLAALAAHAGSRCASPTPAAAAAAAVVVAAAAGGAAIAQPAGAMLTPFFTTQLAESGALAEVAQQAPACLPHGSSAAIDIPLGPAAKGADRDGDGCGARVCLLDESGMPSLDEKTRMLLQCAASSRCYHAGRFRVTSYDLKSEDLSLPNPSCTPCTPAAVACVAAAAAAACEGDVLVQVPTLAPPPHAFPPPSQLPETVSRECCMSTDEEDGDADASLHGSCTMYKRGRFFIKSFCHKGRAAGGKPAVPKSVMLHTASSGLVATTSATNLHDISSPASSSPRSSCGGAAGGAGASSSRVGAGTSVNSLRRTASISNGEIAAVLGITPHHHRPPSEDDLLDQRSPGKTPCQPSSAPGSAAAAPAAAAAGCAGARPVVLPLLSLPPRDSASPTSSGNAALGAAAAAVCDDTLQLPVRDCLGSQAPCDAPAVVECRQYNRGRFNVQENIVVKPQSPPPAPLNLAPTPSPRDPAPSPRGPAPSPRGPRASSSGGSGVALKPGSRFTVVEHSASSSSSRPASSKPKSSPRSTAAAATPAASQQDAAAAAPAQVPKLLGRFKVYEEAGAPRDPARSRRSPRPCKGAPACSPHRSPKSASGSPPSATPSCVGSPAAAPVPSGASAQQRGPVAADAGAGCRTALQMVHQALAQSSRRAAAAAAAATTGETHSSSEGGLGGVDCHVEVQCDGAEGRAYSIQVDVVMGQPGCGDTTGSDDVMVLDVPAGTSSVGGGPARSSSATDEVTVSPVGALSGGAAARPP